MKVLDYDHFLLKFFIVSTQKSTILKHKGAAYTFISTYHDQRFRCVSLNSTLQW